MNYPESLYSIRSEATIIGGLINHPQTLLDLEHTLEERDFHHRVHKVVFSLLKNSILDGKQVDKIILAQKAKDLNISTFEDINLFDYLDSVTYSKINSNGIKELSKELIKLRIKRELFTDAELVKQFVSEKVDRSVEELIGGTDKIYNERIDAYALNDKPIDLYGDIEEFILEKAKNPQDEVGLKTPFPKFNEIFGGLQSAAGIYSVVARPKSFKSTYLQNMAEGIIRLNPGTKCLILDTELTSDILKLRASSACAKVSYWHMNSGNWTKNAELAAKVKRELPKLKDLKGKIYHMPVPDKPINEICSLIKRWYHSVCGRGNKAVVIYDYLKVSGESVGQYNTEYMIIGNKVNALNQIAKELNIVIWTACQLNRSGEGRQAIDDGSAIALSDRLAWYAAFVGIFRKKWGEEIIEDGANWGTHKLIPLYSRFGGKDFYKNDLVRTTNSKGNIEYKHNFLSYTVSDFRVEENGDLNDILKANSLNKSLQLPSVKSEKTNF